MYLENRTYLVSTPILAYYYTQIIGDAKNLPILLAAPTFTGLAVIGSSSSFIQNDLLKLH
jgi:glucan 1,3-beta-glucosidase